jgi:hypothetical protein
MAICGAVWYRLLFDELLETGFADDLAALFTPCSAALGREPRDEC